MRGGGLPSRWVLSMLLHAWLMESHYRQGDGAQRAGGAPLAVQFSRLPRYQDCIAAQATPHAAESKAPAVIPAAVVDVPALPRLSRAKASAAPARAAADDVAVLTQPSDPTYYSAGDLDVFPKALTALDLSAAVGASHGLAKGNVRATLLIDEAGMVSAVRGIEGPARDIEAMARELLLHTRFTPARNKDGRIVKAQLLVALDYDTRALATAR